MALKRDIQLFENLPAGVSITNPQGRMIEVNQALAEILGYGNKTELLKTHISEIYSDKSERVKLLKKLEKGPVKNFRIKGLRKDKSVVWLSVSSNPVQNKDGKLEYVDIVEDITERVKTQEKNIRFSKIFEESLNEIYIFDAETFRFIEVNRAAQLNLGYSSEELINLTPLDIKPEFDLNSFKILVQPLVFGLKEKIIFFTKHQRKNGSLYPVEVHLQLSFFENRQIFIAIILDISEREKTEKALEFSEEKYKAIVEGQTELIYRWKPDGTRTYVNQAYADYYKKTVEELTGTSFVPGIHPDAWELIKNRISRLTIENPVSVNTHKTIINGKTVYKEWTDKAIFDEFGHIYEIQSTGRDVTEKTLAELKLRESEERYRALFEKSSDPTLLIEDGVFIDCNDATVAFLGYISKNDIVGKTPDALSPENQPDGMASAEKAKILIDNTIQTGNNRFEWIHVNNKGDELLIDVSLTLISGENKIRIYTVWRDITSQRKAKDDLLENQGLLRATLESASSGILVVNNEGKVTHFNSNFLNLWNIPSDLIEKKDDKILLDYVVSQLAYPEKFIEKVVKLYKSTDVHFDIIEFKDGKKFERNSNPLIINGKIEGRVWGFNEITERFKAEENLRESEHRFKQLVENLPDAIFVTELGGIKSGRILDVNRAAEIQTGFTREELLSRNIGEDLLEGFDKDKFARDEQNLIEGGILKLTEKKRKKDGSVYWVEVIISIITLKGEKVALSVNRDITEKKKIEAQIYKSQEELEKLVSSRTLDLEKSKKAAMNLLQDSNEQRKRAEEALLKLEKSHAEIRKLSQAVEQNPAAVLIIDTEGFIEYVNYYYTEKTGYTPIEISGKDPKRLVFSNTIPTKRNDIWSEITNGKSWSGEIKNTRKDGSEFWESVSISPLFDENKSIISYIRVGQDITQRKKLEEDLLIAKEKADEATKAKSEFLANMSHEIRTPMNAILGFADLLSVSITDSHAKNYLHSLKTSGKSLLNLINDILDLSKFEAGMLNLNYQFIDLHSLFTDIPQIFALEIEEKKLDFILDIDQNLPSGIFLDEDRLRQVLINLVNNAIKFTEKGHIKLTAKPDRILEIYENKKNYSINLIIEVEDSGIGIPREFQKIIFNSFAQQEGHDTKKYGGTGLGLAISQKLVKLMGGKMTLRSEVGKGSIFSIFIENTTVTTNPVEKKRQAQLGLDDIVFDPSKVLIVDSNQNNLAILTGILEHAGLQVKMAVNGEEAIVAIKNDNPDLIITDTRMPDLDGIELLRFVRQSKEFNAIPIISSSTPAMNNSGDILKEYYFDGYLTRPIQIPELLMELKNFINHKIIKTINDESLQGNYSFDKISEEELPVINKLIDEKLMPMWEQIQTRQPVKKVELFGNNLIKIGEKYKLSGFTAYGNKIVDAIQSFNVDGIVKLIKLFPEIINNLREKQK